MLTRQFQFATRNLARRMSSRVFVTDWDETATVKDTTALIASVADQNGVRTAPPFSHFSKVYMDAYSKYMSTCENSRDSIDAETAFQKGMRQVELTSIGALEETGFFKGYDVGKFHGLASNIELQPGFVDFVKLARCPVYILSVNWCKGLIEETLRLHGVKNVSVLANDLEIDSERATTGKFDRTFDIRTGYDKVVELEKIRGVYPELTIFYFGDSSGDVLPILKADYGGVITSGKGRKVLEMLSEIYGLQDGFQPSSGAERKVFTGAWSDLKNAWTK